MTELVIFKLMVGATIYLICGAILGALLTTNKGYSPRTTAMFVEATTIVWPKVLATHLGLMITQFLTKKEE